MKTSPRCRGTQATRRAHLWPHIGPQGPDNRGRVPAGEPGGAHSPGQQAGSQAGCSGPAGPQISCSAVAPRAGQSAPVDHGRSQHLSTGLPPPQGRHEVPRHILAWVRGSSETRLLLRQRGISMPTRPWGRAPLQPSQRKFGEPRAHAQGLTTAQTSHHQHSGHFPMPPSRPMWPHNGPKAPTPSAGPVSIGHITVPQARGWAGP